MACNGGDEPPVQDKTFVTFTGASGNLLAFGYSADRGFHLAGIDGASKLNMAVRSQSEEGGGAGGGGFFSGSLSGSSRFSGTVGGSSAFSGATPARVAFAGSVGGSTSFTGTTILNGQVCDVAALCDFVGLLCGSDGIECLGDDGTVGFDVETCRAQINQPGVLDELAEILEAEGLTEIFCAIVNFIGCVAQSAGGSFENVSDSVALQCAESSGLVGFFEDETVQ
jgi:hypothetical protein